MPIDFAAVTARFAEAFRAQIRTMAGALRVIWPALTRRRLAVRAAERATRGMPIVGFHGGAVSMRLVAGQRGVLRPLVEPGGFGAQLKVDALSALADVLRPWRSLGQETVIPRLLGELLAAVTAIEASIRRFGTPTPGMFAPAGRTGSDLFGLAGLAFRALAEASAPGGQLRQLADFVRAARTELQTAAAGWAPPKPPDETGPQLPPAEQLDTLSFGVVSAVAAIGVLPALIGGLAEGVAIWLRKLVLDDLGRLERIVLDLRRTAVQTMVIGLDQAARRGVQLVDGAREVIEANIDFTARFWGNYAATLFRGVRDFVVNFVKYVQDWMTFLAALPNWLTGLTAFDLAGLRWLPPITLDRLLDEEGTGVNRALQRTLSATITGIQLYYDRLLLTDPPQWFSAPVQERLAQLRQARELVAALFNSGNGDDATLPEMPEAAALDFHSNLGGLGDAVFGPATRAEVGTIIDRVGTAARRGSGRLFTGVERGADALAAEFADAAARSAQFGPADALRTIDRRSARTAGLVFDPDLDRAVRARHATDDHTLADSFEAALVDLARPAAAVQTLTTVVESYMAGMAAQWRARMTSGTELTAPLTPTSPRLLRKRAQLGRVVLPRLTLKLTGRLDEELAELVAGQFVTAVQDAHRSGRQRLAELAGI